MQVIRVRMLLAAVTVASHFQECCCVLQRIFILICAFPS